MPYAKVIRFTLLSVLIFVAGVLTSRLTIDRSDDVARAVSRKFELHNYSTRSRWMVFDADTGDTWILRHPTGWQYYEPPKRTDESMTDAELRKKITEELRRRGIDPETD